MAAPSQQSVLERRFSTSIVSFLEIVQISRRENLATLYDSRHG
jgi:hypothetical protein